MANRRTNTGTIHQANGEPLIPPQPRDRTSWLFVAELAEVHQAADGRRGARGDFQQVHPGGPGLVDGLAEREHMA